MQNQDHCESEKAAKSGVCLSPAVFNQIIRLQKLSNIKHATLRMKKNRFFPN